MKIAAVVVAYDDKRDPRPAIAQIGEQVQRVIVVDNRSGGHPDLQGFLPNFAVKLSNGNEGGLAGAYNRALAWLDAHASDTTHVLFLDDDTEPSALSAFLSSPVTRLASEDQGVAAVAPIYRDKRTGLRGSHIQLERFRFRFLSREMTEPKDVTFVINSMSLWRRDALAKLGPYSTTLAVDHIDTDFAMRAKRAGMRIVLNAQVEFLHEIGNRKSFKFMGKVLQSGGHPPNRRYLIGRNTVAIARAHGGAYPAFLALCIQRLGYETIGIICTEDNKFAKLFGLWRGAVMGLFVRA